MTTAEQVRCVSSDDKVIVHWSGGTTQTVEHLAADQLHVIEQEPSDR